MCDHKVKYIGYWMSKKKSNKINWVEFNNIAQHYGFELIEVDLERSLDNQAPFTVFLHKLTDIIALAYQGDVKSQNMIDRVESYIKKHPEMVVMDPLNNVRLLIDRSLSYNHIIESNLSQYNVFTPPFVQLNSVNRNENLARIKQSNIGYPFLCKTTVAHGSSKAHNMALIFSEQYLDDCCSKSPCVAQQFIPHNAILYKIFIVGDRFYIVERPSLKNFYPREFDDRETIFFDSQDISKATSQSTLCVLDPEDLQLPNIKPQLKIFKLIVQRLRSTLNMTLFGVDVIIENKTGRYFIIDINVYPGYDGYPDFFNDLMQCINKLVNASELTENNEINDDSSCVLFNRKHIIY